jgi:hypothetical protein
VPLRALWGLARDPPSGAGKAARRLGRSRLCELRRADPDQLLTARGRAPASDEIDRCFGLPLWLQTPLGAHTVWAYNPRHLARIREIVTATLRHKAPGNGTLLSRLPVWLKAANRAPALRALTRLERKLIA